MLATKSQIHWARRLWHMGGVSTLVVALHYVEHPTSLVILSALVVLCFLWEMARFYSPRCARLTEHVGAYIMRESEKKQILSSTYLLLAALIVLLNFEKHIVYLSLLFLAFADPVAGVVGRLYGRRHFLKHKSWAGTTAAFVVCTGVSAVFYGQYNLMQNDFVVASLLSGLVGALSECVVIVDDNLSLPILSACGLHLIFYWLGV